MHSLTAKPLGFPQRDRARDVDQGAGAGRSWKAGSPTTSRSRSRFRKPILLPARVEFASQDEGEEILFAVRDARRARRTSTAA